ncbi:cucumisin [Artemisia annua]|uniref:Cucumisin n=1 Tax=Artemisia annua TaxID=35608 RepID=A0A2U1PX97_ARTAN|nr:cucumisin [Artemisia annua]
MFRNDAILVGNGTNAFPSSDIQLFTVYAKYVTTDCSEADARKCLPTCLESSLIKQKVVMCDSNRYIEEVKIAGAIGYIVPNYGRNVSGIMPYPVAGLTTNALNLVKTYMNSTTVPQVQILKSEAMYNPSALRVA